MKASQATLAILLIWPLFAQAFERPAQVDIVVRQNKSSDSESEYTEDRGRRAPSNDPNQSNLKRKKTTKESFKIEAKIKSKEFKRTFKNCTAQVYVLGRDANDSKSYTLVATKQEKFDLNPGKITVVQTDAVTLTSIKDGKKESGKEYGGYLVVIRDADGDVIKTKATKSSVLRKLDLLSKAKTGEKFRL